MLCVRPPAIARGYFFDLRFVHLGERVEKGFRLGLVGAERIQRHAPIRLLRRLGNVLDGIFRAFAAKNVFPLCIGKVIDFLHLPRP